MSETAGLEIVVSTKGVGDAEKQLDRLTLSSERAERATSGLSNTFHSAATAAGLIAGGIAGIGLTAITAKIIAATKESDAALAQLNATLASMGPGIGYTSEQLQQMAKDLQGVTTYGDDSIVAMQSVLATFGEIKGDTFKQASVAVLDLATKMGTDLKGAALQVGKALNDPTEGMTALRRAGVSFTDSQKEQIKTLQESGNLIGAQTLLLKELQREFGGSAQAARNTLGGSLDALGEAFNDLFELSESGSSSVVDSIEEITTAIQDPDFKEGLVTFANNSLIAVEALAAIIAGRLVAATIASTKQLALKTAAHIAALQVEKMATAEALKTAIANEAVAKAELRLAANMVIGTDATIARAASLRAYNTAVLQTTAAQKAADAASASASVASGVLGGALRLLGGPAGIVTTAALAFLMFRDNVGEAGKSTEDLTKKYKVLTETGLLALGNEIDSVSNKIANQEIQVRNLKKSVDANKSNGTRLIDLLWKSEDEKMLEQAQAKLSELKDSFSNLNKIFNNGQKTSVVEQAVYIKPEAVSNLEKAILALEQEREEIGKTAIEVAKLSAEREIAEQRKKLGSKATKEETEAFEKQAQTLREVALATALSDEAQKNKEKSSEKAKQDAQDLAREFEAIRDSLLTQEQAIRASYERRQQIIENAEGISEVKRENLLEKNNENMLAALDNMHASEFERLASGLRTEEEEIRASYERRRTDIINSEILTSEEKTSLIDLVFVAEQKALSDHHAKMNDISRIYGANQVAEYQSMMDAIQAVQEKSWEAQALTYTAVLEGLTREGSKQSRKMFELHKAAGIANAIVSTYTGAMKAIEELGYWGYPMAALIIADGLAKVNTIRNTHFGSSSAGGGAGGGVTMGAGGGGVSPAPQQQTRQEARVSGTTINIYGDIRGNDAQKIFDELKVLISDGDSVLIESTSFNGMSLAGAA